MPNGEFEFYPQFSEFLPVYQGVSRIWIGDGTNTGSTKGDVGVLYVEYANGNVSSLGSVSLYSLAQTIGGYTGTQSQWLQDVVRIASEQRGVTITATYQTTDNGSSHPDQDSGWSSTPVPTPGLYLWTKYVVRWYDGGLSQPYYTVAYMGKDGGVSSVNGISGEVELYGDTISISNGDEPSIKAYVDDKIENIVIPEPPVTSVNGETGDVVIEVPMLYGTTINIDDNTEQSIKDYIDGLTPDVASQEEIDEMFGITT